MDCLKFVFYRVWHARSNITIHGLAFFKVNVNVRNICLKAKGVKNSHISFTVLHEDFSPPNRSAHSSVHSCHVPPCFTALNQLRQEGTFSECLLGKKFGRLEWLHLNTHELLSFHLFLVQGSCLGRPEQKQYQLLLTNWRTHFIRNGSSALCRLSREPSGVKGKG